MKATKRPPIGYSIEIISAIVRAGPGHRVLGDPFIYAVVVVSVDGKIGVFKALNGKDSNFGTGYAKGALKLVREELGLKPDWVRMVKGRPVRRHKRTVTKKTR